MQSPSTQETEASQLFRSELAVTVFQNFIWNSQNQVAETPGVAEKVFHFSADIDACIVMVAQLFKNHEFVDDTVRGFKQTTTARIFLRQ